VHKVEFADATLSLEDPRALTAADPDAGCEERFICLGVDPEGRVLVRMYALVGQTTRIISSVRASPGERRSYENR